MLGKNFQTYDRSVIPRLVSTLREFFDLNSALKVLIAATIRNEQTFEAFLNACSGSPSPHESYMRYFCVRGSIADFCGVERDRFCLELVNFHSVPEHLQDGPFYPTSTPIQIWRITTPLPTQNPFAF